MSGVAQLLGYGTKIVTSPTTALCSDAHLNNDNQAEGEPTEAALVNFAFKENLPKHVLECKQHRVDEAPFDSGRKMMSTIHDLGGKFIQ